jgi:hypothetical protein
MTSKIKVDNIENQCGGAVVTKCGATTTISGSVVKADDIQAADGGNLINQCGTTITLGASGDTIALAAGASQTGFGRTGTVDWDTTPKTATFTAVSGNGYFVNTTSGAITVNLPAGSAGAIVSLADYAATWQTNNVTVSPDGTDKIGSLNSNATLETEGQSVTFVYVDSTQGWINTMDSTSNVRGTPPFIVATGGTIVTCGNFKTHIFTGPGTFTVTNAGTPAGSDSVDYLVVAGGGGTNWDRDAGGGAGGFRLSNSVGCVPAPTMSPLVNPTGLPVSATGYPITVGGGGAAVGPGPSNPGSNSVFSSITSTAGGGSKQTGGSGGGGYCGASGAAGNTPPVSPPQGNPGGNSLSLIAGGGGGAGAAGQNAPPSVGGAGGSGSFLADTFIGPTAPSYGTPGPVGSTRYFAGGGGGAAYPSGPGGAGGVGGGGAGAVGATVGTPGTTNTGGGAGGSGANGGVAPNGASGGSGIVIIRYKFQ